jgi:hypothetical protein
MATAGSSKPTIWSRMIEVLGQFDSPVTKTYVSRCVALIERIVSNAEPLVSGADIVMAIQSELAIPSKESELPAVGLLGLCINLITIVRHDEEDPVECILRGFDDEQVDCACFPGAYEREN